ncbi:MAG: hypothetical protein MZU97_25155 [Bacillus subtilis]|nr:hypothetical protein [Bacillus subtilis]
MKRLICSKPFQEAKDWIETFGSLRRETGLGPDESRRRDVRIIRNVNSSRSTSPVPTARARPPTSSKTSSNAAGYQSRHLHIALRRDRSTNASASTTITSATPTSSHYANQIQRIVGRSVSIPYQ